MKRLSLSLTLILFAASAHAAGVHRRSVPHPVTPLHATIESWTVQVMTSGGAAPALRSGIVIQSTGTAIALSASGQAKCSGSLTAAESTQLGTLVSTAHPEWWAVSYVNPSNPNGCCDQIQTTLTLTVNGEVTYKTFWFDDHPALPSDLSAIYDLAFKSIALRFNNGCTKATGWTLDVLQEGGFGGNYHRVVADSSGNLTVQPNATAHECHYTLSDSDVAKLNDSVQNADGKLWAASYVRPENPTGCCDQFHSKVQLTRKELAANGTVNEVTYTSEWFSDHPPLPADLDGVYGKIFGVDGLFQRYGPLCGSQF